MMDSQEFTHGSSDSEPEVSAWGSRSSQDLDSEEQVRLLPAKGGEAVLRNFMSSSQIEPEDGKGSKRINRCAPTGSWKKLRLPVFFDLVTDRSRSRFLVPLLFALAFVLVMDSFSFSGKRDQVILLQQEQLPVLDIYVC